MKFISVDATARNKRGYWFVYRVYSSGNMWYTGHTDSRFDRAMFDAKWEADNPNHNPYGVNCGDFSVLVSQQIPQQ